MKQIKVNGQWATTDNKGYCFKIGKRKTAVIVDYDFPVKLDETFVLERVMPDPINSEVLTAKVGNYVAWFNKKFYDRFKEFELRQERDHPLRPIVAVKNNKIIGGFMPRRG